MRQYHGQYGFPIGYDCSVQSSPGIRHEACLQDLARLVLHLATHSRLILISFNFLLATFRLSTYTLANMQATALMSKPVAVQTRVSRPSAIRSFRAPAAPVVARRNLVVRAEVL